MLVVPAGPVDLRAMEMYAQGYLGGRLISLVVPCIAFEKGALPLAPNVDTQNLLGYFGIYEYVASLVKLTTKFVEDPRGI